MLNDYDIEKDPAEDPQVSNIEREFFNAKTYLQTASENTGENLYDHLTDVLDKILAERPENIIDFFEEYSRKVKEQRFKAATDHLKDVFVPPGSYNLAVKLLGEMKPLGPGKPSTVDPEDIEFADMTKNNMLELQFYLEQAGLGLPRQEMVFVMLSMRKLVHTEPIASIRFWGKIFGTTHNYLILETELKEDEYIIRNEFSLKEKEKRIDVELNQALEEISRRQEIQGEHGDNLKFSRPLPPKPKIQYEDPPEIQPEPSGVGLNKKVYYVCTNIGDVWEQLPDVTPKQIIVARQIYKSFTGILDQHVLSYPEFPGTEKNYLRAQIARITAGTQIAPFGYYTFGVEKLSDEIEEEDEEEEDDEEALGGERKTEYKTNPKYDPVRLQDLLDPSISFWVHTAPYILSQGRTTWWDPSPTRDLEQIGEEEIGEEEEDEEVSEKIKKIKPEPEIGPPLLTPCSEDSSLERITPWSVRSSSAIIELYALAIVRSNLWPGAYALSAQGKTFYNIYLGNGLKYMEHNFSPLPLPFIQQEYPVGPEILEIPDPTGAEEEEWRLKHLAKEETEGEQVVAEEEEIEEEEEEDEDEDD